MFCIEIAGTLNDAGIYFSLDRALPGRGKPDFVVNMSKDDRSRHPCFIEAKINVSFHTMLTALGQCIAYRGESFGVMGILCVPDVRRIAFGSGSLFKQNGIAVCDLSTLAAQVHESIATFGAQRWQHGQYVNTIGQP